MKNIKKVTLMLGVVEFVILFILLLLINNESILINLLFSLGFAIFTILPIFIVLSIINQFIKKGKKDVINNKLSMDDFHKSENYFRELIDNYNPAELSYIDDFDLDISKDVIAILLSLKRKGKIDFVNNEIVILNEDNLSNVEKYIINSLVKGKVVYVNSVYLMANAQKDAVNHGLLISEENNQKHKLQFIYRIFVEPCIYFLLLSCFFKYAINFFNYNFNSTLESIYYVFITIYSIRWICSVIYMCSFLANKTDHPYIRSQLGDEVNKKLEGLKSFLKDFSNLDKSSSEEIILWDDYLIYSVLFNQNKKIIKEMGKYLKCK